MGGAEAGAKHFDNFCGKKTSVSPPPPAREPEAKEKVAASKRTKQEANTEIGKKEQIHFNQFDKINSYNNNLEKILLMSTII